MVIEIIPLISTCFGLVNNIIKVTQLGIEFAGAREEIELAHAVAKRIDKDLREVLRLLVNRTTHGGAPPPPSQGTLQYVQEVVQDVQDTLRRANDMLLPPPRAGAGASRADHVLLWFFQSKQQFRNLYPLLITVQLSLNSADRKLGDVPRLLLASSPPAAGAGAGAAADGGQEEESALEGSGDGGLDYCPYYLYKHLPSPAVEDSLEKEFWPWRY